MNISATSAVFAENVTAGPMLVENITSTTSLIGNTHTTLRIVDAVFGNDSLISTNWSSMALGCLSWKPPNHTLFQVANAVLFLGLLSPHIKHGVLFLHTAFVISFLLLSVWAWIVLCAPDYFSWNFAFMIINIIQTLMILYNIKPIKFEENIERLYQTVFQPMNVSRRLFKKLIDKNFCLESTLYEGDAYAAQGITKTDRLGLLVSGTMKVYSHRNLLHLVQEMEFIDSPEFESSVTGDEKFQVSVYAATTCRYLYWPRQSLEYLLMKEPFLATVLNTIMGRDITNKLYALNSRVKDPSQERSKDTDIPLMLDPCGKVGDLRRTLAQLSAHGALTGQTNVRGEYNDACLVEEQEESEGPYSATEEEVDLLNAESRLTYDNHLARSNNSLHSDQGIHFTVKEHPRIHFNIPPK
ncbi:popeye domain-containing protein 3-like [Mercenaria mercenaria]|uniref:popeye domain-containing protein 3-like n=1 Tax=Mercenaria mercenaria TaxID=6596 RepID=UPI00234F4319|nr:popeye domain-containing protein 3-like [Mercenaria mercenaria]XP_045197772.2 popeye domain-containing protein 3-like [Mercenaria mercenaria]XP_045197774.2 popeye domain-containing protein 3-like [Mercenaria mercenaria]XP_045197775.2 popeye domain-containing protein 3-like [Mercenaria mercenaria]